MPQIDLCFQGWIRGATVGSATDQQGAIVDVSSMSSEELARKLKAGELFITLGNFLYEHRADADIELFDFEPTKD